MRTIEVNDSIKNKLQSLSDSRIATNFNANSDRQISSTPPPNYDEKHRKDKETRKEAFKQVVRKH